MQIGLLDDVFYEIINLLLGLVAAKISRLHRYSLHRVIAANVPADKAGRRQTTRATDPPIEEAASQMASGGFLAVDHPRSAEPVDEHGEARGPEGLLEWHGYLSPF